MDVKKNIRTLGLYLVLSLIPALILRLPGFCAWIASTTSAAVLLAYAPYLGFFFLGLLGWKLNLTRITLTALFLAGAFALVENPASLDWLDLKAPTLALSST
jgi:hypothetical protein